MKTLWMVGFLMGFSGTRLLGQFGEWENLTAVGFLGIAFLLLLRLMVGTTGRNIRDLSAVISQMNLLLLQDHMLLVRHDAQIRGFHPSAGADLTEAHEGARREFENLNESFSTVKNGLEELLKRFNRDDYSKRPSIFG